MAMSCPLCCQSISVDLLRTSLISVNNRPLICPICGDVQRSLDNLAAHLTQHIEVPSQIGHTEQHDVNNVIHNININNTTAVDESVIVSNNVKQKCDENMTQKLDAPSSLLPVSVHTLESHKQSTRINATIEEIVQPFICNLCECSFRSQELKQMHMQLVHEINIRPSNSGSKLINARAISSSQLLQCNLCPKRFKMIGSLRLHVRMVHGVSHVPQKVCTPNMQLIGGMASMDLMAATGNEHVMETGDPIASTSASHVNSTNRSIVHANLSDYYSNYGQNDISFGTNSGTSGNSSGGEQKDNEEPTNGNNNSTEMSIVNADDRIHKCDICNKCFTTKYFLKKHKRLHTGNETIEADKILSL